jgi:hypothetical protein
MKAMLDPRMVAANTQGFARWAHFYATVLAAPNEG